MKCTYTKRQKEKIEMDLYYGGERLKRELGEKIGISGHELNPEGGGGDCDVYIVYSVSNLNSVEKFIPESYNLDELAVYDINIEGNFIDNKTINFKVLLYLEFKDKERDFEEIEISQFEYRISSFKLIENKS